MPHSIAGFLKKFFTASLLVIGGFHAGTVLAAYTPGNIYTVAGSGSIGYSTGSYSGDNGPATSATFNKLAGVAVDGAGNLYIADSGNNRIRKVAPDGTITTVAGNGNQGYSGDNGLATLAALYTSGVAVDSAGNLYIADALNHRIRKVTASTGIITTVAGNGTAGYSGDNGPATSAELSNPSGIAADGAGNLFIADANNNRIRKVAASTGIITTVAGNGILNEYGDYFPATSAALNYPVSVAVDGAGNLYIADNIGNTIRKVAASTGIINTVAGNGSLTMGLWEISCSCFVYVVGDNGPATSATFYSPSGVAVDGAGNLYIADWGNNRIRKVTASTGIITTVAGNGGLLLSQTGGYSGDNGPATSAMLDYPSSVALDGTGNLYIGDWGNNRVRMVAAAAPTLGSQTITFGTAPAIAVGGTGTISAAAFSGLPVSFTSNTPSICTVSGSTVNGVATGTCTIAANQAGNSTYSAAPQVAQNITVTAAVSRNDCLFNWAEQHYSQYFAPAGATDVTTVAPYTYRYYSGTGNYLAISSANNSVYVMGFVFGGLRDVGPVVNFLTPSGCQ